MNNFFQKKNSTKGYEVLLQSYPPNNFSQPYSLFSNYLQLQNWGGGGYKNAAAIKHF